jgi:peptidyl-tRNA hydrolase
LEIHFESSKKVIRHGQDVLNENLWRYTSEDENPQNRLGVRFIRLGLPTFLAGDQIELADTPGLDAYGLKEHEDLTLREFLPQADLIIYLTPIGSPMKDADRRVLNQIVDAEQRVIFVQTCKGSVVEQSYGDGTVVTVESQLERYKEDFRSSLQPYSKIKDAPIVQIETTEVLGFIKERDEEIWRQSGLWEFLETLEFLYILEKYMTTRHITEIRSGSVTEVISIQCPYDKCRYLPTSYIVRGTIVVIPTEGSGCPPFTN